MSNTKIQDEGEVRRWMEDGMTYAEMAEIYREKYNIDTSPSMWAMARRRLGVPMRIARDDKLIPWAVKAEHRWDYPIVMLRMVARRRQGFELTEQYEHDVDAWLKGLEEDNTVVHYDPETDQGWFYVPRREGVDLDLIREPERGAKLRDSKGKRASEMA